MTKQFPTNTNNQRVCSFSDKLNYFQCENDLLKQSKLQYVRLLFNNRQIINELQQEKQKTPILCNCQFTSSRRPYTSNDNKGDHNHLLYNQAHIYDQQPQLKKIIDLFITENQWLYDYVIRLENERDKSLADCLINKQLAKQYQDSEQYVITELSNRIQELNKTLIVQSTIYYPNQVIRNGEKTYKPQIKQIQQMQMMESLQIQLTLKNGQLVDQNNQLLVLNSVLGIQLKKFQSLQLQSQQISRNQSDEESEIKSNMIEVQKKMLRFDRHGLNDSSGQISSKSNASEDYEFFVYSNRVQNKSHTKRPQMLPSLDITKAQMIQQIQLQKQQEQQEKIEKQITQKVVSLQVALNSENLKLQQINKQDEQFQSQVDKYMAQNSQLQIELGSIKNELDNNRQHLNKFQNLYLSESVQNKILTEQIKQQTTYIDDILRTNDVLILAYQSQDAKLKFQQQVISRNRSSALMQHKIQENSENLSFDEMDVSQYNERVRVKSQEILSPFSQIWLSHKQKKAITNDLFSSPNQKNSHITSTLTQQIQGSSQLNDHNQLVDLQNSSLNYSEGFDEAINQFTNRTKLKQYSLNKSNNKTNSFQQ